MYSACTKTDPRTLSNIAYVISSVRAIELQYLVEIVGEYVLAQAGTHFHDVHLIVRTMIRIYQQIN